MVLPECTLGFRETQVYSHLGPGSCCWGGFFGCFPFEKHGPIPEVLQSLSSNGRPVMSP